MPTPRTVLIWSALASVLIVPLIGAATSPLLAWRQAPYIIAGFAGVLGLCLLLCQPLLAAGRLPGLAGPRGRRLHRAVGVVVVLAVIVHVVGLWMTSPPDVVDALLFRSPTPFSAWGVIAMWAVFATATLALLRKRRLLGPRRWRIAHTALSVLIVLATVIHAMRIEGTMEPLSKTALCLAALAATVAVVAEIWHRLLRPAARSPRVS